jgi:hypothetical protein
MHTTFWLENLKKRAKLEGISVNGRIILKGP